MWIHRDLWTQDAFKHKESEPEECAGFLQTAFSLEENTEWERSGASHLNLQSRVFLEKKIRNPGAAGRITPRSRNAVTWENRRVLVAGTKRFFVVKTDGIRARSFACHMNLESKWTPDQAHFVCDIHNDFSGVGSGLRRGCILARKDLQLKRVPVQ